MSKTILVMGESGSGKTTAMRNLDAKKTYYIDCDKKGLSWKGWKQQYNAENKNYKATSDAKTIKEILIGIDTKTDLEVVVVDTLNGIMIDDEFARMKEKNYDKWADLAYSVYDLVSVANNLQRDNLTIIFTIHSQTDREESGYLWTRAKTSGKKLDKVVLESKFTTVLLAKAVDGKYVFETRANNSTTKTPLGAFDSDTIENDIVKVLEILKEY